MRYARAAAHRTADAREAQAAARPANRLAALHRAAGNEAVARLLAGAAGPLPVQRVVYPNMSAMWAAVLGAGPAPYTEAQVLALVRTDHALGALYDEAAAQLPVTDFRVVPGLSRPQADVLPPGPPPPPRPFAVSYDPAIPADRDYFAGAIIHELAHVVAARAYQTHGAAAALPQLAFSNLHLPAPGPAVPGVLPPHQAQSLDRQMTVVERNWEDLYAEFQAERATFLPAVAAHVEGRILYAGSTADVHNETVLGDVMYYLAAHGLTGSRTFRFARRMLREANDRRARPGLDARAVDRNAWWFQYWTW